MPNPPSTRGISVCPTYTRQPGRETRSIARDHRGVAGRVFQVDPDRLLHAFFGDFEVGDIALFLEDARDIRLQARGRHVHLRVARLDCVAHARQHVGYWITVSYRPPPPSLPARLHHARNLAVERQLPETQAAQMRTCAGTRADGRSESSGCGGGIALRLLRLAGNFQLDDLWRFLLLWPCSLPLLLPGTAFPFGSAAPALRHRVLAVVVMQIFMPLVFSTLL